MAKWNINLALGFLSLGLLSATPNFANADSCYDPCCDPCSFGGFEIGADFLYWKPCVDNLDFAVVRYTDETSTTTPVVTTSKWNYKCLCLDWEPGFRIRFAKDDIWCNWRLSASYTWVNICDSGVCKEPSTGVDYVYSPFFHPILGAGSGLNPSFTDLTAVKGSIDTSYQTWDVLLSYDIACNRCHSFQPYFGVEGVILDQKVEVGAFQDIAVKDADAIYAAWTSNYFGVGLKIGTGYEFQMFDCMKFYSNASATIAVGNHDGKYVGDIYDQSGNIDSFIFNDGDCCQFLPGYHLAAGLLYETDACGTEFAVRIGWEFVKWCNVSNARAFSGDAVGREALGGSPDYSTLGFHGLVAGLDFKF